MPLVPCPDCNTEVSDQAPACPKCGRPMSAKRTRTPLVVGAGGIYGVVDGDQEITARDAGRTLKFLLSIGLMVVGGVGVVIFIGLWLALEGARTGPMLGVVTVFSLVLGLGVRVFQTIRRPAA